MRSIKTIALSVALGAQAAISFGQESPSTVEPPPFAKSANDDQWTMPAKNLAATRYSELAEITIETVKDLKVEFTFSLGVNRGQEAAP